MTSWKTPEEMGVTTAHAKAAIEGAGGSWSAYGGKIPVDFQSTVANYDPDAVSTSSNISLSDVEADIPDYEVSENSLVSNQLTGLLSSGSPYVESARQSGLRTANERGLLNSSIAAQSAEQAAIEAALPIAQQDAGTYAEGDMAEYTATTDAELTGLEAQYSSMLSAQEALEAQALEALSQNYTNYRQQVDNDFSAKIEQMGISSDEKQSAANLIGELGDNYQNKIANVQADTNMSDEAKADLVEQLQYEYEQNVKSVADIYGVELEWLNAD